MKNPLLTETIGVYIIDMNTSVHEQVVVNGDGSYSIFLNARLSYAQQMDAYQHTIRHIMNEDFSKSDNVTYIEKEAHNI